MKDFTFHTPTEVLFGRRSEERIASLVRKYGGTKVLLHYGGSSAERSGLLPLIRTALAEAGIGCVELGGVVPNPRLTKVREGIDRCRAEKVDFLLAVGGGSVIDSAKAIGYGLANGGDPWDFYDFKRTPTACAPVGVIVTIAAAGSEMSNSSVITNEDGWLKRGCNTDYSRPRFAIMDPELTMTLPDYQTACGCADVLMHTMERYFNFDVMDLTDALAEGLMRTVIDAAKVLGKDPKNYEARANVLWASSLSHNGLTGCGAGNGDWACHRLEHEVGGMFDVAHGAGLAAIWGSWARYVYKENPLRFAKFAVNVHNITPSDCDLLHLSQDEIDSLALSGIKAMENFYHSIDMPISLTELGITVTEEQIEELAEKCTFGQTRTVGIVKKLDKQDIIQIYQAAR